MLYSVQLKNLYSYLNSSLKLSAIVRGLLLTIVLQLINIVQTLHHHTFYFILQTLNIKHRKNKAQQTLHDMIRISYSICCAIFFLCLIFNHRIRISCSVRSALYFQCLIFNHRIRISYSVCCAFIFLCLIFNHRIRISYSVCCAYFFLCLLFNHRI